MPSPSRRLSADAAYLSVVLHAIRNRVERLFSRRERRFAEWHLRDQLPLRRQLPFRLDLFVDERIVVLQGSTESFLSERRPYDELQHSRRLIEPDREVIRISCELLLQSVYDGLIFEE